MHLSWRYTLWVAIPFIALTLILILFTFPETYFNRGTNDTNTSLMPGKDVSVEQLEITTPMHRASKRNQFLQQLKIYHGTLTQESLVRMLIRPVLALCLPPVLWAASAMGVNLGFFVILNTNYALAYSKAYNFLAYQSALCWIAGVIGGVIGVFTGGRCSDLIADYFTKKNNGIREPEMRLPAMAVPCITGPLSLILYGVGIEYRWHWMVPTTAIGLSEYRFPKALGICSLTRHR